MNRYDRRTVESFRSLLVVPATDAGAIQGALASDADAVMCDLEDLVAADEKDAGRATLMETLLGRPEVGPALIVRVNGVGDPNHADDLRLVARLPLDAVALPKADPAAVGQTAALDLPIVAVVETANGLLRARELVEAGPVARTVLGGRDLAAEVGLEPRDDQADLLVPRALLALHATAARLGPPVDVVFPAFDDLDGLRAQALYARTLGFGGKACIHAGHAEPINAIFTS